MLKCTEIRKNNNLHCPLKNASFGILFVGISQLFEPHLVFEDSVKSNILLFEAKSMPNRILSYLSRLSAVQEINQFEHKSYQKTRYLISNNFLNVKCRPSDIGSYIRTYGLKQR